MDSDKDENEEGFLAESHITGRFEIPGEKIDPVKYFGEFKLELEKFSDDTKDLYVKKPGLCTNSALLSYAGEPKSFMFDADCYFRHFLVSCRKANKDLVLNEKLASVRYRKSAPKWKTVNPKYALCLFKSRYAYTSQPGREVIFHVKIYKPYLAKGRQEDIKISQEVWLTGEQTLRHLRDVLFCHLDYRGLVDVSNDDPATWSAGLPKIKEGQNEFPSCFFFVNRTFYATSDSGALKAQEFLEQYRFGRFSTEDIDTKLKAINIEIGRPYVYQHLGQCEHVFVFSDVRLMSDDDPRKRDFPFVNATSSSFGKQCMLCDLSYAQWLVTNFAKLMLSRAFLCHRCFICYCYIGKRKAGDFQAYQYLDPNAFL